MKHTVFIPVVTAFFTSFAYPQIELPRSTGNQIVSHTGYTLSYNEEHEQADWVAYKLTASEVRAALDRTNDYRADQ
jgi:endonuclease G